MFDWQKEDEHWADEAPVIEETKETAVRPRRWWPLVAALTLSVVAALLVYRQVQQQTAATVAAIEADVISSHALLQTAVADQDEDLFKLLLSGRDMGWFGVQQELLRADQFFSRAPFGLVGQPAAQTIDSVTLNPNLTEAELLFAQEYKLLSADGVTETVTLAQTAVYRRGDSRWLLAPPDGERYWGGWQSRSDLIFSLAYPERDAALVERIYADLADWLPHVCATLPDLPCDPSTLNVRLETETAVLTDMLDPNYLLQNAPQLALPAPSLVGVPVDEAGYAALLRSYQTMLATALIVEGTAYDCCERTWLYRALLDYQLAQLGLQHWPITNADHYQLWTTMDGVSFAVLESAWNMNVRNLPTGIQHTLYIIVDFLLQMEDAPTAVALQQSIATDPLRFESWLNENYRGILVADTLAFPIEQALFDRWRLFTLLNWDISRELPAERPLADLAVLCADGADDLPTFTLHQFDMQTQSWRELAQREGFALLMGLADDSGFLLEKLPFNEGDLVVVDLWRNGERQPVSLADEAAVLTLGQFSPNGRLLTVYSIASVDGPSLSILQETANCLGDGCIQDTIPGVVHWSPNGSSLLTESAFFTTSVFGFDDGRYWLVNNTEIPLPNTQITLIPAYQVGGMNVSEAVGEGFAPFWIDETRYGFVQQLGDIATLLVQDIAASGDPQTAVLSFELSDLLPEPGGVQHILYAAPRPQHPDQLVIVTAESRGQNGHLFWHDLATKTTRHLAEIGTVLNHQLAFSPNGRFVTTYQSDLNTAIGLMQRNVLLIDLQTQTSTAFTVTGFEDFASFRFDWTADSRWLAVLPATGMAQLYNAETGQNYLLDIPAAGCGTAVWVNHN